MILSNSLQDTMMVTRMQRLIREGLHGKGLKHGLCAILLALSSSGGQVGFNALCQSCGHSYFKVPNFDKLFLCGFSSRVSKILRRVVQTPQEYRKIKKRKILRGKRGEKCKKHEGGVCEGQDWSQKNCLDKRNDICFMHFLRKHPLIAKKWSQSLKKLNSKYFESIFWSGKWKNICLSFQTFTFHDSWCSFNL